MVTLDLPWDVDVAEDHHLVVDEEHVPGQPSIVRLAVSAMASGGQEERR